MTRSFHRKDALSYQKLTQRLNAAFPLATKWYMDEQSGANVLATNSETLVGRNTVLLTYADYTAGAGWSDLGSEIAHCDGIGAGLLTTTIPDYTGKSITIEYTISNYVGGSVRFRVGNAQVGTTQSGNDTYSQTIVVSAVNPTLFHFQPFSLEGDIDLKIVSVKQTGILASSVYAPGTNPMDGTNTAAAVGQVADGNLEYGYAFDGATSFGDIYSAELNSKLNPDAMTLIAFANSNTWAAGIDLIARLGVDADNEAFLSRSGTDLILSYDAGGTAESVTIASGSPTDYFMVAITVDTTGGGAVKAYYNGVQSGTTQTIAGTWVGNLASTLTVIGANATTPANVWDGDIAFVMTEDRVYSSTEIADIQKWSGL